MRGKTNRALQILVAILPGLMFLAARFLEKLLLRCYELTGNTEWPSGDWAAAAVESVILAVLVYLHMRRGQKHNGFTLQSAAFSLLAGIALGGVSIIAGRLLGLTEAVIPSVPKMLVLCAVGPVSEEIVYRGFVLERCRGFFSVAVSIVISSLLFAAAHGNVYQITQASFAGLAFGIIAYKTSNIRNSCLSHAAANTIIYCLSLA